MTEPRAHAVDELARRRHETAILRGESAAVRRATAFMSITSTGTEVTIRMRGDFDDAAVERLWRVIGDLVARGGRVADVVLDLGVTTHCSNRALEDLGALVGAGMRLSDVRHERPVPRARGGHRAHEGRASRS